MGWVVAALVLGILLNLSSSDGNSWPIGSVVAIVIIGIWLKVNQDMRFEELKKLLTKESEQSQTEDCDDGDASGPKM